MPLLPEQVRDKRSSKLPPRVVRATSREESGPWHSAPHPDEKTNETSRHATIGLEALKAANAALVTVCTSIQKPLTITVCIGASSGVSTVSAHLEGVTRTHCIC